MKFRNWSCLEIECKQFAELLAFDFKAEQVGQFLDAKRVGGYRNELKQSMGEFPVGLIDLP
jgi:hypothetical protein